LWQAETTTRADRQQIARLLLERAIVTVDKDSEKVDVQLHCIGGLVRSHVVSRPVMGYRQRAEYPQLVERLRMLSDVPLDAGKIAEQLNAEGFADNGKAIQRRNRTSVIGPPGAVAVRSLRIADAAGAKRV
jgi:hypothetical protein